jgi:uncharacterized protein (DUF2147 family)
MNKIWLGLVLFASGVQIAVAQPAQRALGIWADEDGKSNIEIANCGGSLCGRVVWLKEPKNGNGQLKTDVNNPDAAQRSRPILGLTIIRGLQPDDDSQLKGLVYNAEDGKIYDFYLKPRRTTMEVEGCFAIFLCGSQTWTRVQ